VSKNIFLISMVFIVLGVFTLLSRIERVEMSAQINNIFLINTEGCKIPKLDTKYNIKLFLF
jgi:hypothetical protein